MLYQLAILKLIPSNLTRRTASLYRLLPVWVWLLSICLICAGFVLGFQNYYANAALHSAQKLDSVGQYSEAKKKLSAINQFAVFEGTRKQIQAEDHRNQQLAVVAQKLAEVQQLLKAHKTQAAESLLQSISKSTSNISSVQTQVSQLQKSAQTQAGNTSASPSGSSSKSGSGSGSGGGNAGVGTGGGGASGSGGGSGSPGGSTPPPPGPMTSISVTSFTASAAAATASTCNISDSLTFSTNGSGSVTTTWSLFSTKSLSETVNPTTYTFSAAGSQSDSFNFSGTQGLEPGDSYRVSVTIVSTSNSSISTTAGPITLSNCAAPPSLAAEKVTPFMTTITPGTLSVYQAKDTIFPNECSVQVTTPYSVNSSGTVEAIVMVTSGESIGYTYYDSIGATSFNGSGSTSDTSYFRLPHLPGGGNYTITVKLVEVSSPGTVFATTSAISSGCS